MGPLTAQALAGAPHARDSKPPIPITMRGAHLDWASKPLRLLLGFCLQVGQAVGPNPSKS